MQQLYKQVFDHEIAAAPRGISDKAVADWLGVTVARVAAVRAKRPTGLPGRSKALLQPADEKEAIEIPARLDSASAEGSLSLLRAQLRTGQHFITDPAKLSDTMRLAGMIV